MPVSSTSVSGLEKVLIINLDESRFEEGKDRAYYVALFEERFSDIPVKIRFNVAVAESCNGVGSNCDPLVGGIKIEAKNHVIAQWHYQLSEMVLMDSLLLFIV